MRVPGGRGDTTGYGRQAGGTHPTEMLSYFLICGYNGSADTFTCEVVEVLIDETSKWTHHHVVNFKP